MRLTIEQAQTPSTKGYLEQASQSWDEAWAIVQEADGWTEESGHNAHKGCVSSRKFRGHGKVFRLQARLDASPAEVFDVLVTGVNDWPIWNPTILECKPIQTLTENTDISYSVGASAVGGLVSSRDFVNLRHWKERDGVMMASAVGVTHPDMPGSRKHVRAENHPACYAFAPVEGHANKCDFTCILCTDLKGWMPQFLIDQALSGVLLDYLTHLRDYLQERQTSHTAGH